MSSRAAASRKRLVPSENSTRPSSSKSFFSRSKSNPPSQTQIDLPEQEVPPTSTFRYPNPANNDSHGSDPYRGNLYAENDSYANERLHAPVYGQNGGLAPTPRKAAAGSQLAYASHESDEHQVIRLSARSPRGNGPDEYESGYIEASYQPPPPIQASYQPPPPTHAQATSQHNAVRSSRKYAQPSEDFDAIPSFPAPPTYPPSVPSTPPTNPHFAVLPSSTQSSLLLQRSSPTPTELPTYSFVHETPYPPSTARTNRIPHEVSVNNSSHTHHRRFDYSQQYEPAPYAAPATRVPRLTPSPFQVSPAHSASSLPGENDFRRPVYRSSNGTSSPSSPFLSTYQVPAAPPTNSRPAPESISGSDSSGNSISSRSPSSNGPSSPATSASPQAFIFPGSRSTARPKKVPKSPGGGFKINGRSKSRMRSNSDASSTTPPTTPSSSLDSSDNRPPVGLGVPKGPDPRFVSRTESNTFSDTASAFSDDSSGRSVDKVVSGTWTAAKATTTATTETTTSSTSPSSDNANAAPAPPKMVYPGGRSRAKPSKPPVIKPKKPKRPSSIKSKDSDEREEKSRFMGLLKRKKQPKIDSSRNSGSGTVSQLSSSETDSSSERRSVATVDAATQQHCEEQYSPNFAQQESMSRAQRAKSRIGSYPLDPYDSVLLDNDRHTGELLVRLNSTNSPSFHNYGNTPPMSVLDLGCGQGHWVVDAAIAWRGYGTKVTGYDMVDISKGLLLWAVEQGVTDNIRFVRGNFLKQRLPFSNNSFDLIRMSCLALCVTADSWVFLLQEVCRVLMVGGRLELIDDLVFFPYGKASSSLHVSSANSSTISIPPQLDITIPTSSFTTFSIYDQDVTNPGLGHSSADEDEVDEGDFFDLYEVEEEPEFDDTATLNGREAQPLQPPASTSRPSPHPRRAPSPVISPRSWNRAYATSGDLEALFDHMLSDKFGIRKDLHEFILDLLKDVFGHAREMRTMNLALAPPESAEDDGSEMRMGLSGSPGLILWPSTFIPMNQSEIEIHASKHLRMLLSCKNFLLEHALEATDDEEIDEESVLEALWEYEGFLRHRFNPPPMSSSPYDGIDQDFDAMSVRGSIAESVSSDSREAMWEIQSEFRQRFAWQRSGSHSRSPTPKSDTPTSGIRSVVHHTSPTPSQLSNTSTVNMAANSASHGTPSPGPTLRNPMGRRDNDAVSASTAPVYSRDELTCVRTFRVYEAIKIDETLFGSAM
ncbi:hypothetical protein BDN70DRAFT_892417 [Pholiota conissans]|uniref:Methyltransferase domain-containing protein n=1 Tax=Pholiota conissans TaxID=109636 RepID=A0A9P5Z732_9AGAR|nr:hypothetical protein BDN70DRAFT_892417 [Pholiota conissans]